MLTQWSGSYPNVLSQETILVFCVDLSVDSDALLDASYALLDSEELRRAHAFKFDRDRVRYVLSHAVLRFILSRYLKIPPKEIVYQFGEYQKPALSEQHQSDIHFNLSHSGDYALIGVTRGRAIGVDIEIIKATRDLDEIAKRFFADAEIQAYFDLPASDRVLGFYQCWTRKEAFIKAIGSGLYHSLKEFVVSLGPNIKPAILSIKDQSADHWQLFSFSPAEGYAAAVAIESEQAKELQYINWTWSE